MIRRAQDAGFTLLEIRALLSGFSPRTPPPARWRRAAEKKLVELDAIIQQTTTMKRLLEKGLRCECLALEDCVVLDWLET